MIEIDTTEKQITAAETLYPFAALRGSISKGYSNKYGALGEIVVNDYFKKIREVDFTSTYDYDMIIDGKKVDVKAKQCNTTPLPEYLCSISSFNTKQKCDFYFFCRVKKDFSKCYILGYISKKRFYKEAFFKKKGELDINGWEFKDDSYHIQISKLNKFKKTS